MFIIAQGSSRSVVFMEWDKIWAMNKKVIDPIAPRFTTLNKSYHVEVRIKDVKVESVLADKHPKDPEIGKKTVWRGPVIYIDGNLLFFLQFIFSCYYFSYYYFVKLASNEKYCKMSFDRKCCC